MDMALVWVIIGGLFEPVWVIGLKKYNDTKSLLWGAVAVAFMFISPAFMSFAMEQGMNVGVAYSIWTGIGALFTLLSGVLLYKEKLSVIKVLLVFVIIAGVAGIEVCSGAGL